MNVPTCCRKIPIPYALLSGLTTAGLLLMAIQARPLPGLTLPPVPVIQTREIPEPEPEPIPARPKRDPFRPLNHPVTSIREVPVKKGSPAVPAIPAMPDKAKPAVQNMAGGRLCGIVQVNGRSKALIRTASGSVLAGAGENVPGMGPIEEIHSKGLTCQGRQLNVGEVWP